jgi:hypothetical protein
MSKDKNVNHKKDVNKKSRLQDFLIEANPKDIFGKLIKLDEGCFGVVYKALHKKTNTMVINIY